MKYNEQKGNLFELDEKYSLVQCISLDCKMGKGIAVEFDKRFKGMKTTLQYAIKEYEMRVPVCIPYASKSRYVFNLVTKKVFYGKPTYRTITDCIKEMKFQCEKYEIKFLGLPKIGCGLDRLQWGKVREIIQEEFKDLDIEIEVRYL